MPVRLVGIGWALNIGVRILTVSVVPFIRVEGRSGILRLVRRVLAVSRRCVPIVGATPALVGALGVAVELVVVLVGAVLGWRSHPSGAIHRLGAAAATTASNETENALLVVRGE